MAQARAGLNSEARRDDDLAVREVVVTSLLAVGCHAVQADAAGAYGQQRWVAADESFGIEFLSPPWAVTLEESGRLELEIPPEFFGVALDGSSPSHVFQMGHVDQLEGLEDYTSEEDDPEDTDRVVDTDTDTDTDTEGVVVPDLGGLPDTLVGLDLRDPYAVARAELDVLIAEHGAQLDYGVSAFPMPTGADSVEFQVQMDPGIFVRVFYVDARPTLVRATFVSLFDLDTGDVASMARTLDTVEPGVR